MDKQTETNLKAPLVKRILRRLTRLNFTLHRFICKEESRYSLHSIQVTPYETQVTDGHLAIKVTAALRTYTGEEPEDNFETFQLARRAASKLSGFNKEAEIFIAQDSGTKNLTFDVRQLVPGEHRRDDLEEEHVTLRSKTVSGIYPDIDRIIPKDKPVADVVYNLDILTKLLSALKELRGPGPNHIPVRLRLYNVSLDPQAPSDALLLRLDGLDYMSGQRMMAIAMPLRISGDALLEEEYEDCLKKLKDKD